MPVKNYKIRTKKEFLGPTGSDATNARVAIRSRFHVNEGQRGSRSTAITVAFTWKLPTRRR